jgi:hypothetical protein
VGDPSNPGYLDILECGGEPDPETTYTITGPDGNSERVKPESSGLLYRLPRGSPPGTYQVQISSRYGSGDVRFEVERDSAPHIYVYDSVTGAEPAPVHPLIVEYVNFQSNAHVTVGLYTHEQEVLGVEGAEIIDSWEIHVDSQGRFRETLESPHTRTGYYTLIACAADNCSADEVNNQMFSVRLVKARIRWLESVPSVADPSEAVKTYYNDPASNWGMTSIQFKVRFYPNSDGGFDFERYLEEWAQVSSVELLDVRTIAKTNTTATVLAQARFRLRDGREFEDGWPRIELVWDAMGERWLVDDKGP